MYVFASPPKTMTASTNSIRYLSFALSLSLYLFIPLPPLDRNVFILVQAAVAGVRVDEDVDRVRPACIDYRVLVALDVDDRSVRQPSTGDMSSCFEIDP